MNMGKQQEESLSKFEVKHKYIDFQRVQLGQKIRMLNNFIDDQFNDNDQLDEIEVVTCKLNQFNY